jgi:hypothetical protein
VRAPTGLTLHSRRYYKKFTIADLDRMGLPVVGSSIAFAHINNTLIIRVCHRFRVLELRCLTSMSVSQYKKPVEVLRVEADIKAEFKKTKDGDADCAQQ